MDRRDDELGYAVWHEDGTADYGAAVYQGTGRGLVDQVSPATTSSERCTPNQLATIGIEVDGERAVSEAYATVRLRTAVGGGYTEELYVGRYLDRWSYRNGRWAIDHRVWILDFDEQDRPVTIRLPSGSNRDTSDPSYAVRRGLTS